MTGPIKISSRRGTELLLIVAAAIVVTCAEAIVDITRDNRMSVHVLTYGLLVLGIGLVAHAGIRRVARYADPIMLPCAVLLVGLGLVMIHRLDLGLAQSAAEAGQKYNGAAAASQVVWALLGLIVFIVVLVVVRDHRSLARYAYTLALVGLFFLLLPAVLPATYSEVNGARIWIHFGSFSIQPGEFSKIALTVFAAAYLVAIAGVWLTYSKTYIFHGLKPTLTAGFGQVDFRSRMEMQRRIMARLGGVTTRIRLRTDRGSDTGLMTRFHLVRIWRDGSVVFVGLFALLVILPTSLGGARANEIAPITVTQTLTFLLGILAMNWAFSERENLWILLTAAKSTGTYFRGLMLSFAVIGLGMSAAFLVILDLARPSRLAIESLALPVGAPIAAAFVATAVLTRVKLKPSAFSFAALGIFFLVSLGGFLGGLAAQAVVVAARVLGGFAAGAQAVVLLGFVIGLAALGLRAVTRLAASFRL